MANARVLTHKEVKEIYHSENPSIIERRVYQALDDRLTFVVVEDMRFLSLTYPEIVKICWELLDRNSTLLPGYCLYYDSIICTTFSDHSVLVTCFAVIN